MEHTCRLQNPPLYIGYNVTGTIPLEGSFFMHVPSLQISLSPLLKPTEIQMKVMVTESFQQLQCLYE